MKLVISAEGPGPYDKVDMRFGRAPFLVVYDMDNVSFSPLENSAQVEAARGAGIQTAQRVAELGAEILLSGHCGPKAFAVLAEAGVEIFTCREGTVLNAVRAWQEGVLEPLTGPDRAMHH